ncbi:hypothetical protein A2334_01590 [Candidatus Roizmanbacteria bacterium RIFOXYB2_FULL_38_10]|uniref:Sporulation stage II protein D amidase enhancer LytB N-terminal domain-containing protein n=1 Tax=Candidatus Roizmanbacteria bacterium RIFOXYD1_FULL_38_12 TaxID=1802093 RepID=A0A1F7L298_9BACT|nr:MAG: hypothetical protein A3K47_05470 [Candidatus Roizmanbacteria bacterium RIFOXYA2_FULL_38_14]OGK64193.1 MAG: hypothetical protein A3K27_05470 [Candidatus Roizmanbacteria bacterium RIFOXYA1_FULL_37_12]OGK66039.1 MAG: hypothetical protein A3K38_05470 [Candidatus Roizmanbacteria bacterium RIFOXYB1_FULL_40_23]OGK68542.1 MAG: hypothetical protein A2334_01590 [Candidatus Roizmanbacteria bacterium RIFOXYB2_FULL_38_10]OGK70444.1 MAG: hypothetical protein A3K21_05475 [Candidatus Roizmanbacteria ba
MKKALIIFFIIFISLFMVSVVAQADQLDDVTKELEDVKKTFNEINSANQTNEATLNNLNKQLTSIKGKINTLEREIAKKQEEVDEGEKILTYQKKLLDERARTYYKNAGKNTFSFMALLLSDNLSVSLQNFFYQKTLVDEDRKSIIKIVMYIKNIEDKKISLESETKRLAVLKEDVDKQSQFLSGEVEKTKAVLGELQSKIAQLTSRQQDLIAQRQAALNIPRAAGTSMGGCVDDREKDPGFSPRFAFFTFGVPNRVGLNQYGAYGRSKAGQNVEDILRAYYDNYELKKDYDQNITINVEGKQSLNIEDYLKHLGEMPEAWGNDGGFEALKAQAVAARSYALAYTNNGAGSICGTDHCQVFLDNEKGGKWNEAVEATRGWVMVQGGNPIKAWFSSTHGGIVFSTGEIGWSGTSWTKHASDTRESAGNIADLRDSDKAYDKASPWFYCDWGSRSEYNKTAWLTSGEAADMANIIMLARRDSSTAENLYQVDKPNPAGKETWDHEKVKSELRNRGGTPFNSISEVSISADVGGGRTTGITFSGDAGSQSFDGSEFKNFFNLRAPANIQIVGPLFNVEKR